MQYSPCMLTSPPPLGLLLGLQVDKLSQSLALPALPVAPAVATPVPDGAKEDKGKGKAADKKGKKVDTCARRGGRDCSGVHVLWL